MLTPTANLYNMKDKAVWKLPQLLKSEGVTPYRLHKELQKYFDDSNHKPSQTTVYAWSKRLPDSLKMDMLMSVISVLREETGKEFNVDDLLEYEVTSPPPSLLEPKAHHQLTQL